MTAKPISIIDSPMESGDQAVLDEARAVLAARDDVFMGLVDAMDAKLAALEHKLELKIAELIAKIDEEEGDPLKLSG